MRSIPATKLAAAQQLTMPGVGRQAGIAVMLILLSLGTSARATEGPQAQQLRRECEALIELAVKRPYGMAWTSDLQVDPKDRKPTVSMEEPGTPAAGLVLLWAGDLLEEPKFIEAGVEVARGVAAAQTPNGNIPSQPQFGPRPGGRELPSVVPPRGATRAGIALLLGAIGTDSQRDEMFERSARRAAHWLVKQQTHDGGWPTTAPAVETTDEHYRLIRLDDEDVRDSSFALLLAANMLDDALVARAAQKSVEKLISLRLGGPERVANLWTTFYQLNGALEDKIPDAPPGGDVLASRRAIEALASAAVLLDKDDATRNQARGGARDAARTLRRLRDEAGTWRRLYLLRGDPPPEQAGEPILGPPATRPADFVWITGKFGLEDVLPAVDWLEQAGPEQLADRLATSATLQERLAATIAGLRDDPLSLDWPTRPEEVEGFIASRAEQEDLLRGGRSDELDARVRRAYRQLLRARLEAQFIGGSRNP